MDSAGQGACRNALVHQRSCSPSCSSVASAVLPEPTALGVASDVKLANDVKLADAGCHDPSARRHAHWGQWQKPLLYLPATHEITCQLMHIVVEVVHMDSPCGSTLP